MGTGELRHEDAGRSVGRPPFRGGLCVWGRHSPVTPPGSLPFTGVAAPHWGISGTRRVGMPPGAHLSRTPGALSTSACGPRKGAGVQQ